jgi:hypothetical protein
MGKHAYTIMYKKKYSTFSDIVTEARQHINSASIAEEDRNELVTNVFFSRQSGAHRQMANVY